MAVSDHIVELLLMAGANVNAADLIDAGKLAGRSDRSAFFLAAQECHISTMRLLLKYRANPDQPTEDGFTPLQVAAQVGNDRVIDFLLEQGVALETLNRHGATALHTACQHGNEYCVSALLAKGAAVNVHSENGASPLMLAASTDTEGHRRCIQLLVEAGAIIDDNVLVAKCSCCGPHCGRNALFALCASSLDHALGELLNSKVRLSPAALRDARRYAKLNEDNDTSRCVEIIKEKLHQCAMCGNRGHRNQLCASCKDVYYCGTTCQSNHWQQHKQICKRTKKEKSKQVNIEEVD